MSEVNAQKCGWCDIAILTDHEEHVWDESGQDVYHYWCAEESAEAVMENFVEEEAIELAREEGKL
jgi:hypothetical protein